MRPGILVSVFVLPVALIHVSVAVATPASDPAAYPFATCIVSGGPLGGEKESVAIRHDGRELRFCSEKCLSVFEKNASSFLSKLDQMILEDQLPRYPLATCVVSGEELSGGMGEPASYIYGNRLVRFCCMSCEKGFEKKPESHIAKIDEAAISLQAKDYPTENCPISQQKLGAMGKPYDYVFAGRLVRLCCSGCVDKFKEYPTAALAAIYGELPVKGGKADDRLQGHSCGHGH